MTKEIFDSIDFKNNFKKYEIEGNKYYIALYNDQENHTRRIILDTDLKEISNTFELKNGFKNNNNLKPFEEDELSNIQKKLRTSLKNEKDNLKRVKKTENKNTSYTKMSLEERLNKLDEAGIKVGNIYKFETKYDNDISLSYFEVFQADDNELRLRRYSKNPEFRAQTNLYQKANADNISGINAVAILQNEFAVHMLNAKYQEHPDNEEAFVNNNVYVNFTDITKAAKESELKQKKSLLTNKHQQSEELDNDTFVCINTIPEDVKRYYKQNKKIELSPENYTKKLFEMTKALNKVDYNYQNISDVDKKLIKPLLDKYKTTDGSDSELKKVFNQFIFDNQDDEVLDRYGILFMKTRDSHFNGYEKKHSQHVKSDMDDNLRAIKENKHPLQQTGVVPDYIYNPVNNAIYRGNNQMALARNNLLNGINTPAYVPMSNLLNQNANISNMKAKCMIIANGMNSNGQYVYTLCVPCKPTRAEKKAAKEEMRRNIFDAKYKYKYGSLPEFNTKLALIPEKQPPVENTELLQRPGAIDLRKADIETQLNYDIANYIYCSLTKEPFQSCRDWKKEPAKSEFFKFALNNPEKMMRISNVAYENTVKNARPNAISNENSNTNNNVLVNMNENVEKKGRKRA